MEIDAKAYRVLKPFGHWAFGDLMWSAEGVAVAQMIRRGVLERAEQFDAVIPTTVAFEGDKVELKPGKPRLKKARPAEESDDGQAGL